MQPKKLFLLDAFALIFRAYYALIRSPRITSTGINTNAQFGFTNTLLDILNREKPTHIAVCFDTKADTIRHDNFAEYKANRQEAPEDLIKSIPDIKEIINGFNIPIIELDGYEADDIIGTLAWQVANLPDFEVYMVTPDKDYGQLLVKPNIFIYKPPAYGNPAEIVDAEKIRQKWEIQDVRQVIDILGLMGDAVDNIPGIPGVGEKTAIKLLKEYNNIETILENADKITGSLGEKIRNGKESAIMSKSLATIITDTPIEFDELSYTYQPINQPALEKIFNQLEFKTLSKRLFNKPDASLAPTQQDLFGNAIENKTSNQELTSNYESQIFKTIETVDHQYFLIDTSEKINELIEKLQQQIEICFDTETTGINALTAEIIGMSFSFQKHQAYYVPLLGSKLSTQNILNQFKPIFENQQLTWIGQNIKYDLLILKNYGIDILGSLFDTMLAHYVIEPESRHNMDLMSTQLLKYEPVSIETLIGKKGKQQLSMRDAPIEKIKEYAGEDADITLQLKQILRQLLQEKNVENVFFEVENPLVKVLVDMEYQGINIDVEFLNNYSLIVEKDCKEFEESVYSQAGVRFNLASPKQLGEVLFDKLQIKSDAKKTKTGQYATGEDVIQKLAKQHPIVDAILNFRELSKLKSTYIDAIPALLNPNTKKIHTSFSQAVAVTGRLSSNNPNLQNIPIRTERGKEIRKAFIPSSPDGFIISADYSQIELRIVAAISGDKNLCQAFIDGKDIHTATAAKVFKIAEEAVSKEQRYKAKSVNFGIIYGQGAFGLAENLSISRTEAKDIIDNYKLEFPAILTYMESQKEKAKELGYVETLIGRKRWLNDIHSKNFTIRGFAERNAINSPIQGTAADMIKLAMIKIFASFNQHQLKSKMVLQVHDELLFDVVPAEIEIVQKIILDGMVNALPLPNNVPVEASIGIGKNWLEAH